MGVKNGRSTALVTGVAEIDRALRSLEPKLGKGVIRKEMRKALKDTQAAAKQLAPVASGAVRDAIKIRAGKAKRGRISIIVILGAGDFVGKTFYGSFVDLGTKRILARMFMTRAFESTKESAKSQVIAGILAGLEKIARER